MTRSISSAFWARLQNDVVNICELITLDLGVSKYYWTTANKTLQVGGINYEPFPGQSTSGIEESSDLGVSVTDFIISNSGNSFADVIEGSGMEFGDLTVKRVFVDTPGLGSYGIYKGRIGDYTYNRAGVKGQARNAWNSADTDWPPYTYMDGCAWRFGSVGCGFDISSVTVSSIVVGSVSADNRNIYADNTSGFFTTRNDFYDRGRVTFVTGANSGQQRAIYLQGANGLIALYASMPARIAPGDIFTITPGCRKRFVDDCVSKYNNSSSFLGFPWMPVQDSLF
jgi:uncharacterized phage protein (TIGR02218 family)